MHSLFAPWQGFANAYVYGIRNGEVKRLWKQYYAENLAEYFNGDASASTSDLSDIDAIEPKALKDEEGDDC